MEPHNQVPEEISVSVTPAGSVAVFSFATTSPSDSETHRAAHGERRRVEPFADFRIVLGRITQGIGAKLTAEDPADTPRTPVNIY